MSDFRFRRLEQYRVGGSGDKMELRMPLPKTPDGKTNQRCPARGCRPAVFQIGEAPEKRPESDAERHRRIPGPGETICPYCGYIAADQDFIAPEDVEAVKKQIMWAVEHDVGDWLTGMARDFNSRAPRGGLISVRMDVKNPFRPRPMAWREDLLRDLVCHLCARRYGVYAVALFCPDCGGPNLRTHFAREVELIARQTELAEQSRASGNRELAYRLLGNAHEDVLTAFETYLKTAYRFLGREKAELPEERKRDVMRNRFQNLERARKAFGELGFDPFDALPPEDLAFLRVNIEKRHVIGHNLGIADESYVSATKDEAPGRPVRVLRDEVLHFGAVCEKVVARLEGALTIEGPAS